MNFVDYEKAFFSLDREALWKLMHHYGISDKSLRPNKNMDMGKNCGVLLGGRTAYKPVPGINRGKTGMFAAIVPFSAFPMLLSWLMT